MYENGDIIVRGIQTTNFIAGRLEVCVGAEWRAVCDSDAWTQRNVRVACRQLGLNESKQHMMTCMHFTDTTLQRFELEHAGTPVSDRVIRLWGLATSAVLEMNHNS